MAEFDLAALMKDVSRSDTGEDKLQYIPYGNVRPDPNNGYSMTGLDELARSIEIVGLQQPIRVRRLADDTYMILSGHRRYAAIGLLIDRGSKQFDRGVPCVVDSAEVSAAMQELKLLLANADNRKLTSADEAQQAERISDCIRRLEDEGYTFPGRHRDWVAQLSGMSRTKLARLDAIRNNMTPELHKCYKEYAISEAAAYELQKLPASAQDAIAESCRRSKSATWIGSQRAQTCAERAKALLKERSCPDGSACDHTDARFLQVLRAQYSWQQCHGGCCLKCSELHECKYPCTRGKKKQSEKKAKEAAETAKTKEASKKAEAERQEKYRRGYAAEAQRLLPLIEAAGLKGNSTLPGRYSYYSGVKASDIRKYAAGEFGDMCLYSSSFLPTDVERLTEVAARLGCTLDYLAGRSDTPQPAASPEPAATKEAVEKRALPLTAVWHRGTETPPEGVPVLTWTLTNAGEVYRAVIWDGSKYVDPKNDKKELTGFRCARWIEIPEDGSAFAYSIGWVPVEKGMPPAGKYVLTVDGDGDVDTDVLSPYNGDWYGSGVTHWMDLPPTPGEEGASVVSEPDTGSDGAPGFRDGTPPREGRYLCLVDMGLMALSEQRCEWRDGQWYAYGNPVDGVFAVKSWYPLPPEAVVRAEEESDGSEAV